MKDRPQHPRTRLVALYCGVWVALAPIVPELHHALAHHRHVFCAEHHRIEDAEPDGNDAPTRAPKALSSIRSELSRSRDLRPACAFSNFVAPPSLDATSSDLAPVPVAERRVAAPNHAVVVAVAILHLAPKHSPPLPS